MRTCVPIAIEDAGASLSQSAKRIREQILLSACQPGGEHRHVLRGRGICSSVVLNSVE